MSTDVFEAKLMYFVKEANLKLMYNIDTFGAETLFMLWPCGEYTNLI